MSKARPVVLGIDPGSRQIGVAVFEGSELVFYGMKSIKKKTDANTLRKLRKVISKLIESQRVEYIAVEKAVFIQQQTSFVKGIYEEILKFARTRKVRLLALNPKYIRRSICGNKQPTKRNTALRIIRWYTELERYFIVPKIWQKRYYSQMFDAIAAAIVGVEVVKHSYIKTDSKKVKGKLDGIFKQNNKTKNKKEETKE